MLFKRLRFKKKSRPDLRFVDAEVYRAQRKPIKHERQQLPTGFVSDFPSPSTSTVSYSTIDQVLAATTAPQPSFYRDRMGQPLALSAELDEVIKVESAADVGVKVSEASLAKSQSRDDELDLFDLFLEDMVKSLDENNPVDLGRKFIAPNCYSKNSLGIFSDSRAYSALIKQELRAYDLDIRHFNHPNTFIENRYDFFDRISCWIVFLSDDGDEEFIDRFLDRYSEKPTLFLCPKTNRWRTQESIKDFIELSLLEQETDLSDI